MNKIVRKIYLPIVWLIVLSQLCACVSNKGMVYMQGAEELYKTPQPVEENYSLKIKSDDQLAISISSKNKELISIYDTQTLIGGGSAGNSTNSIGVNTQTGVAYFYVDRKGFIDFPIVGKIKAEGLTINEMANVIQEKVKKDIHDAIVSVRITSFKVTILGDVRSPGVQTYTGERLTLLEALGRSGDLNNTAIRTNVLVLREEGGKRVSYKVDLTKPESLFKSPAYYLQQNDLVYVESNKSVKLKGSTSYTYLTVSGTLVGIMASVASLILALTR